MEPGNADVRPFTWRLALPLALFVVLSTAFFWNARGDDLASSFVGCRVLAAGQGASLYSYDPLNFAAIADGNAAWKAAAATGSYHGWLHPYVQTPLWAWTLRPVCTSLQWPAFLHLFLILAALCLASLVFLVARYWAPVLCTPAALAIILGLLCFSEPFLFAMVLVQTHALVLLLTVAGIVLAQRHRPVAAGLLVACAAAIKITPGILLLYWLAKRQWRTSLSLIAWSALLLLLTRVAVGAGLFHAFRLNMQRVSHVLLVAENNQSFAAWTMGRFFSPDEVFDVNAFVLPASLGLLSTALMAITAVCGGWMDAPARIRLAGANGQQVRAPFGAALTMIAMTIFAPIAWTHYFFVLVVPMMLCLQTALTLPSTRTRWLLWMSLVVTALLLFRPFAPDVIRMDLSDFAVLRGSFYAALVSLATCAVAWRAERFRAA